MNWSTKKTLAEFAPRRGMDEFFRVNKNKAYGVSNQMTSPLGKYSTASMRGNPRFDIVEYFGRTAFAEGDVVDKEKKIYYNPGNLEKGQGYAGETGETYAKDRERPFAVFDSPEMGIRALAMDLQTKIKRHKGDINKIVAEYAPDNENDTKKYQEFVKQKLKKDTVTNEDLKHFVQAIIEKENSPSTADYYLDNPELVTQGVAMSYFQLPEGTSLAKAKTEIMAKESTMKGVLNNDMQRLGFRYGGNPHGGGSSSSSSGTGGQGQGRGPGMGNTPGRGGTTAGSGTNTSGRRGRSSGIRSMRDSGMVSTSTGYGPAGAGGQAQGPSGNQGNNQNKDKDKSLFSNMTLNYDLDPFALVDYDPTLEKNIVDKTLDKFDSLKSFVTIDKEFDKGDLSISPDVKSDYAGVQATFSFEKGGLLDKKRFKKA